MPFMHLLVHLQRLAMSEIAEDFKWPNGGVGPDLDQSHVSNSP